jgi:uncharacterized membrane protein HdeD (DUF308 family)
MERTIMWFGSPRTLILRGLVTIAFGVLLVALPAISLSALILLFGAFALVDGVLILTIGIRMASGEPARPIALLAGALAVVVGIAELMMARSVGRHSSLAWFLAALGLVSIVFGVLLLVYPGAGILALVWLIGLYAIAIGSASIARVWLLATRYA